MEKVTWETKAGKKVTVTIDMITTETKDVDGHKIDTATTPRIDVTTHVEGMGVIGGEPVEASAAAKKAVPGAAGMVGKMIIMQDNMDQIEAAITSFENTPEWQAKIKNEKATRKIDAEYEAHRARMDKAMAE